MPTFNSEVKKMKEICKTLKKINRNNYISFSIELRDDYLDEKSVRILKQSNIKSIEAGLETINFSTQKKINKFVDLNKFVRGIYLLNKAGIICKISFLFGLPGETFRSFIETVIFLLNSKLYQIAKVHFTVLSIGPGTCLRKCADKYGIEYQRYPPYCVIETEFIKKKELKIIRGVQSFRSACKVLRITK